MTLQQVWLDLHADTDFAGKNVMTEYEAKFSSKGQSYLPCGSTVLI